MPPQSTAARSISAWNAFRMSWSSSGSICSLSAVKSDRSMNTMAASCRTGFARKFGSRASHSCTAGAWNCCQRPALGGEILRAAASRPQLHADEHRDRRHRGGERGRASSQTPCVNANRLSPAEATIDRGCRDEAECAPSPGEQAHQQHRQQDRDERVGDVNLAVAHDAVAGDEMRDRGRDHLDAGHQGIERRREEVAAAGNGGADHDDPVLDRLAVERAVEMLCALTVRMVRRGP